MVVKECIFLVVEKMDWHANKNQGKCILLHFNSDALQFRAW